MASEALADQLFEANDSAHKGYLDKDDLTVALVELLGYEPRKSDIERYQNARGEYRVTRAMFGDIVGSYRPLLSKPNRREAFQCLDDKGQGFLKLHDLIAKGQQLAPHMNERIWIRMFAALDHDNDGKVAMRDLARALDAMMSAESDGTGPR
eukprot:TRINITY_DN9594_c0_g2_i1.p1 TRINITY_DN9594_c0_g2~~TRINITY_DN9594_c0_g2_i1.p1  ORF type:complete len:152 (+),score=23.18 TRINITY_DN9594_c0_g2_i1:93-548(+)